MTDKVVGTFLKGDCFKVNVMLWCVVLSVVSFVCLCVCLGLCLDANKSDSDKMTGMLFGAFALLINLWLSVTLFILFFVSLYKRCYRSAMMAFVFYMIIIPLINFGVYKCYEKCEGLLNKQMSTQMPQ